MVTGSPSHSLPLPPASPDISFQDEQVYDLIGIGFGPANLALSIALRESPEAQDGKLTYLFVERQANFAWHSSLLLPGSQLQVSPLKDLATMRDPTSSYTFFNYLHQQGRLAAYINRESTVPSRREWSAYLAWAARRMEDVVRYHEQVLSVEAHPYDQQQQSVLHSSGRKVRHLKVTTRNCKDGQTTVRLARNITVAIGGVPRLPLPFQHLYQPYDATTSKLQQVVHSSSYLPSLAALEPMLREREAERRKAAIPSSYISSLASTSATPATCLRFAVIGGGQSSAEITLHLKRVFPTSNVQMIFRSSALVPSDDSAFVNSVAFDPSRTDAFWNSSPQARSDWTKEFKRTNYSVVNKVVLNDIYDAVYDQEIQFDQPWPNAAGAAPSNGGHEGLVRLQNNRQVNSVHFNKETQMVELAITSTKKVPVAEEVQSFDAVFLGTGFDRRPTSVPFLEPISTFFPMLDTESTRRKTELGFEEEEETDEIVSELLESQDEYAVEKLRERVRGIARDYRLVNYWSDAFSTTTNSTTSASSGSSSSRSTDGGATPSSSSSSETLNGDGEETTNDKVFEPSVFFLGGNEQTHGLSDSLLSIVAHRAGEVCDSIIKSHTASFRSLGENHHPVDIAKSLQSVAIKCSNASCPLSDDTTAPIAEFTQPQQSV